MKSTLICFSLLTSSVFAHGPGKDSDFAGKRVLFIGIDGCRAMFVHFGQVDKFGHAATGSRAKPPVAVKAEVPKKP